MRPIAEALLVAFLQALIATACMGSSGAAAAIVKQDSIVVQGQTRTYSVYLPESNGSRRYPIVMMLHGGEGTGASVAQRTGLGGYVDREGFIAVFPDAGSQQWNDGRETTRSGRDDVGFLVAVVHDLVARSGGDRARVFVGGLSNGGIMAQRLACEATGVFAAYAVAIANMPYGLAGTCRPSRRVPIIFFESTADPLMPWAGGEVRHGPFHGVGGRILSIPQTIDFWAKIDGCGGAQIRDLPDRVNDNTHVRVHDFGACGLVLYEIQGGGHAWPGSNAPVRAFARRIIGNVTQNISATSAMIDFFRRFGL